MKVSLCEGEPPQQAFADQFQNAAYEIIRALTKMRVSSIHASSLEDWNTICHMPKAYLDTKLLMIYAPKLALHTVDDRNPA